MKFLLSKNHKAYCDCCKKFKTNCTMFHAFKSVVNVAYFCEECLKNEENKEWFSYLRNNGYLKDIDE